MTAPQRKGYLQDAARLLDEGVGWAGLHGDALAFALASVAAEGRWLVVVDGADRARRLLRGLRTFHAHPARILHFPADDTRPYDGFSPAPEVVRARLLALHRVEAGGPVVVVAEVAALLQRVPDSETRQRGTRSLAAGDELDRDELVGWLVDAGYLATGRVIEPGCFAVRGDVVDVWPAAAAAPARIDFFDDEIETVRAMNPATQRAGRPQKRAVLIPAREERLDGPALDRLHRELGRLVSEQERGVALRRRIFEDLRAGMRFSAVEDYLPALVACSAPLEELAGLRLVVDHPDDVAAAARDATRTAERRYAALDDDERPLVPPSERYASADEVLGALEGAHAVYGLAAGRNAADLGAAPAHGFAVRGSELGPVVSKLDKLAGDEVRVALVVDGDKRVERLLDLLEPHGLNPRGRTTWRDVERGEIAVIVADLVDGFVAPEAGWAFIPVSVLFGGGARAARHRERVHTLFEVSVTSSAQLKQDDHVVHRLHGVGLYRGLHRLPVGAVHQDFVKLEYRGGDLMFLPVTKLDQLSRYTPSGQGSEVRLDRLGGATWLRRKGKVRDSLLSMANELLRLHARRELATRVPFPPAGAMSQAFEARFPYEETPDQALAIEAVAEDLSRPFPMDRLLCGDVGFGKTEVAMRAAVRVVEAGRQVAVLCPTTVLAYQHVHTLRDRFGPFEVEVAMLSRFNTPAEDRRVRKGLADGSVQLVVGTTALLGRSVRFSKLGLVVVDEEHRFGVRQKDRLKRMRAEVDILSMSATPIPRTLQMALGGLREMSLMATPPADRLAVRTQVAKLTETRVRDAIETERRRGGQVFFIHNRVETIERFADRIRRWVPDARIAVAHGQMDDEQLEDVLVSFIEERADVLVCTAIVESGVDLPNVNTMLVDRADLFGLSQLYQLRGRVGRGHVRATCLLLVPEELTSDARKRLQVLVEHTQLGSGFQVAAADLELRGGGNLLGKAQSGNIDKVGYDTWVELLQDAVREAQGERDRELLDPEVEVGVDAFLPDDFIRDVHERLGWYRKLSAAHSPGEIDALLDELEVLQGDLPIEVRNLAGLLTTRLQCRDWGIERCSWLKIRVRMRLHEHTKVDEAVLRAVIERHPKRFELKGPGELDVRFTPREGERPFQYIRWVFAQLQAVR